MAKKFSFLSAFLGIILIMSSGESLAQTTVIVTKDQSIREIARQYLGDPDLWEEILRSNNLASPDKVVEGVKLIIPVEQVKAVNAVLNEAMSAIQSATEAGAKTFASVRINKAVSLYEQGVSARKRALWNEATKSGKEAKAIAAEAEKEAVSKSQTTTDAVLNFIKGVVEGKQGGAELWKNLAVYSKLLEEDKVRTLSGSYAEILFKDKSRIKLNENSQVLIQKTRVDLLKNKSEAEVKLEKGDAFAYLSGGKGKKNFNFNIPGVKTDIKSKSFWVKREEKKTKIANYEGEIQVQSKTSSVTIAENQGSTVSDNGSITAPKNLLPAPKILAPSNQQSFFSSQISLQWESVAGTVSYLIQISKEQTFKDLSYTAKSKLTQVDGIKLGSGNYFLRIASEDSEGFIGPFSEFVFFNIKIDVTPPFIAITSPADSFISNQPEINLSGSVEKGSALSINGSEFNLPAASESFSKVIPLLDGANSIKVEAKDSSNNTSSVSVTVFYENDLNTVIKINEPAVTGESELVSAANSFTLKGNTRPFAKVNLSLPPDNRVLRTKSDSNGNFVFNLIHISSGQELVILVETRTGYKKEQKYKFVQH